MAAGRLQLTIVADGGAVVADVTGTVDGLPDLPPQPPPIDVGMSVDPRFFTFWYPQFPAARYARVFFPPGAGGPAWNKGSLATLPTTITRVGVSWKDKVPAEQIVKFADMIPPGRRLDLTWRHEPEPDWPLPEYRAGWKEIAAALDGHPSRDRVSLVNIHTLWASRHKPGVDWRAWMLPGIADVEGWDCYRDTQFDVYEPAESLLGLPYLSAQEFGTRWSLPELGATLCKWDPTGAARARWYRDCAVFAGGHGCEALGFWCSTNGSGSLDYRPADQPTAASWTAAMTSLNR